MSVQFDYAEEVKGARQLVGDETYESEEIINSSDDVFFQSFFNPGHDGNADWVEYDFYVQWKHVSGGVSVSLSYKIQYKSDGGSWTDFCSGTVGPIGVGSTTTARDIGIKVATIAMPMEVRIVGTETNKWKIEALGGATYTCYMRAVGTVT